MKTTAQKTAKFLILGALGLGMTYFSYQSASLAQTCNAFGCSQPGASSCNPFGCPNPGAGPCTPFGCPASPVVNPPNPGPIGGQGDYRFQRCLNRVMYTELQSSRQTSRGSYRFQIPASIRGRYLQEAGFFNGNEHNQPVVQVQAMGQREATERCRRY